MLHRTVFMEGSTAFRHAQVLVPRSANSNYVPIGLVGIGIAYILSVSESAQTDTCQLSLPDLKEHTPLHGPVATGEALLLLMQCAIAH
jgi:hypothetical protein